MSTVLHLPDRGATVRPAHVHAEIARQPARVMQDWQREVVAECGRHATLCRPVLDYLKRTGLLSRCVLLAAEPGGPMVWKFIGQTTIKHMGAAWARTNLGRAAEADERTDFGKVLADSYAEAIDFRAPVVNRIQVAGLPQPLDYTHSLLGWRSADGTRAVLSCVHA
ncbi:MAG TPA: hypothetical protein VD995_04705 [Azospirillum sp.]|nr:hypothetical protein [Azospirillum sp.]